MNVNFDCTPTNNNKKKTINSKINGLITVHFAPQRDGEYDKAINYTVFLVI